MRLRGSQIGSFMPSVDTRAFDEIRVIGGQNYLFDSKGPKSGFTTKMLSPFGFGGDEGVEGKRLEGQTFIFTNKAILGWQNKRPTGWEIFYSWDEELSFHQRTPWSAVFMEDEYILTHQHRGFFRGSRNDITGIINFRKETDADVPGLTEGIYATDVVRNRLIVVTKTLVQWSGVGDSTDFTPTPAGAGFQLLSSFVQGEPIELMGFKDGFIVWTKSGAVLAEFMGGDQTWRWTPFAAEERPISPRATVQLMNGAHVFLTQRGFKLSANGQAPQDFTPEFNEFLREYLKDAADRNTTWALTYDPARELIFLAESVDGFSYWRTFVLAPTIDKWGVFSDRVYGFMAIDDTRFGYVDTNGLAHYFYDNFTREAHPPNEWGLNLLYPRRQKESGSPSSTLSIFVASEEINDNETRFIIEFPGWYDPEIPVPHANGHRALDSAIELGYFKPPEMNQSADGFMQIQEVVVGTHPSLPSFEPDFTVMGREEHLYFDVEDWNVEQGAVQDWNIESDDVENWNHPAMDYSPFSMEFQIEASSDGQTYQYVITPELARFDLEAKTYTCETSGTLHRLIFRAHEPGAYYHISYLELTAMYGGQLI